MDASRLRNRFRRTCACRLSRPRSRIGSFDLAVKRSHTLIGGGCEVSDRTWGLAVGTGSGLSGVSPYLVIE